MATYIDTSSKYTVDRTELVGVGSIAFMRPINIGFRITDCKPNTRLYAFFDGRSVDAYITNTAGVRGGVVITDSAGRANGSLWIPPMTFNTGDRLFRFQETPEYDIQAVEGNLIGSASAVFKTVGVSNTLQRTYETFVTNNFITEVNIIDPPPPVRIPVPASVTIVDRVDPLAQSFHTFNVNGGCFIVSVDLFFYSKDTTSNIPVVLQLRDMVNGYPGQRLASPFSTISLVPSQINASTTNSALATTFTFPVPIYLEENKDWCFVLLSNSNRYSVWTSKLGETSKETGLAIFEQPFIGSMFKSENNVTWTAEQTEDIKFTMRKAVFSTAPAVIKFKAEANPYLVNGDRFSVVSGSNVVTAKLDHMHGLRSNDWIAMTGLSGASYRGIPSANLTGNFLVQVLDDYTLTFPVASNASSTGTLAVPGGISKIAVDAGGTGYTTATITITGGGGTGAAAYATIAGSIITNVVITNAGTGYVSVPTLTLSGDGTGAKLALIAETIFIVGTNNVAHGYTSKFINALPPGTEIKSTTAVTDATYMSEPAVDTQIGKEYAVNEDNIILSTRNQTQFKAGLVPTEVVLTMTTTNPNTSPIISMAEKPKLVTYAYAINNQTSIEDLNSTNASLTINQSSLSVTAGGTGYPVSTTPALVISGPDLQNGIRAVGTATVNASGIVTGVTITTIGTGYIKYPTITVSGSFTSAAAILYTQQSFNSELNSTGGTAVSKYVTKQFALQNSSEGIRMFVNAISQFECGFDCYIRTSSASENIDHKSLNWRKLSINTDTNLSKNNTESIDYTFFLDKIPAFDVYDIKIVLRSTNKSIVPALNNYRVIVLAS